MRPAQPSCRHDCRWLGGTRVVRNAIHRTTGRRHESARRTSRPTLAFASRPDEDALRVLIAAGGTGGHVYPAVAVAEALRSMRTTVQVEFVGTKERLEWEAVQLAGFPIASVPAVSLRRPLLSPANLLLPFRLALALLRAIQLVALLRPHVILGTGGYVSFPTCLAGWLLRRPVVLQEQNALPGLANRVLSRFASLVCLGIPTCAQHLPKRAHTEVTGNPIRESLASVGRAEARQMLEVSAQQRLVVVMGGSLGSGAINEAMTGAIPELLRDPQVVILWAAGTRFYDELSRQLPAHERLRLVPYLHDMGAVYAAADLVVGRSGAITCSELMATGSAAVLVPLASAVDDHQTQNARYMASRGAAVMLTEAELSAVSMASAVRQLLGDQEKLAAIRRSAAGLAPREAAAGRIAALVLETAAGRPSQPR